MSNDTLKRRFSYSFLQNSPHALIGVARGANGAMPPKKIVENIVILCFEGSFSQKNSVICLKSNILAPPNFFAGYATACSYI